MSNKLPKAVQRYRSRPQRIAAGDVRKTPALKGAKGGNCNREACQAPGAVWFNHSTLKHYCARCARDLNRSNYQDAQRLWGHELCTIDEEACAIAGIELA